MTEPKILLFDLECAPALAWTWGLWNVNIGMNQVKEPPRVLCWSARWLGTKGNRVLFQSEKNVGHTAMLQELRDLLDQADVVVGYNSDGFDIPWTTQQFKLAGIDLPSPYAQVDLFKLNKKHLRMLSGKLDWMALQLLNDRKVSHSGFQMWIDVMDPESPRYESAWKEMEKYAKKDTLLLEPLFEEMRPFIRNLNWGLFDSGMGAVCTHCGSANLQARGVRYTTAGVFQRYQCNDCAGWSSDPKRMETTPLRPMANN